jgi:chromosome segregation ATPase
MGTQAGDASAIGGGAGRRRFSRPENGSNGHSNGNGSSSLSDKVAGEVRELLGASEEAARAIRDRAASEAEALRDALIREAEETRRESATRAQQEIAAVVGDALARLSAKAATLNRELDELRAEANRFAADLTELGARMTPAGDSGSNGQPDIPADERRARLIALTMAINGASREETGRYLQENLGMREVHALLDTVYC